VGLAAAVKVVIDNDNAVSSAIVDACEKKERERESSTTVRKYENLIYTFVR